MGCCLGLVVMTSFAGAMAEVIAVGEGQRTALGVTLYGNGMALVDDRRTVSLSSGNNQLRFSEVGEKMLSETAVVKLDSPFQLLEQHLLPANLTQSALLEAHLGKTVNVVQRHPTTGEEIVRNAEVVSVKPQLLLRIGGQFETSIPGRLVFASIPEGLRSKAVFEVVGQASTASKTDVQLRYLTQGFSWKADHVASFDEETKRLRLESRATLTNQSGIDLMASRVQMVAGNVNRVTPQRAAPAGRMLKAEAMMMSDAAVASAPTRQSLGGFHLYSLQRPVDLADGATKQVLLLPVQSLPAERFLISETHPNVYGRAPADLPQHPRIEIEFKNDKEVGANAPVPAGILRLYGTDKDGNAQFLGENHLANLPVGEIAKVSMGQAFDVTVRRKQTEFKREAANRRVFEAAFEVRVLNGSSKPQSVQVVENFNGDWQIVGSSTPFIRSGNQAVWSVAVPAESETKATYRVRIRQ